MEASAPLLAQADETILREFMVEFYVLQMTLTGKEKKPKRNNNKKRGKRIWGRKPNAHAGTSTEDPGWAAAPCSLQ